LKQAHENLIHKNGKKNLSNLTPLQSYALRHLNLNQKIIIKPTDKNLGPAAMDMDHYILQVLKEHLLTNDYTQLSKDSARHKMETIQINLKELINQNQHQLNKAELVYFQRSLKLPHRIPIFYGLPKVHKTPVSLRPVVSTTNSFLAVFSVWLDYKMKDLLSLTKSYMKKLYNSDK
jgi:hypothetical protein